MIATALRPGGTVTFELPVQMMPGPHGLDSPAVVDGIERWRWFSWIQLIEDREHRRRSQHAVIEWALGHPMRHEWPAWWYAPGLDAWEVHLAQIADVNSGGQMLLSACLRSAPWTGANDDVIARADAQLTDTVPWCPACRTVARDRG